MIRPIKKHIVFQFIDPVDSKGQFERTTKTGIYLPGSFDESAKLPRWATIVAIGPDVDDELKQEGIEILIDALQWTPFFNYDGRKMWRTDESKIIGYRLPEDGKDDLMFVA